MEVKNRHPQEVLSHNSLLVGESGKREWTFLGVEGVGVEGIGAEGVGAEHVGVECVGAEHVEVT